jgi:integrase
MSKCFENAVRQNIIPFNPVKRVDLPKKTKFMGAKFYNGRQIAELLTKVKNDPLELVIFLTVFYGLRRSEVLGLKWDAVDFTKNTISIRHTVVRVTGATHKKEFSKLFSGECCKYNYRVI